MTVGLANMPDPQSPTDRLAQRMPSFPFPSMASPMPPSPASHHPFIALSPTLTPKLASAAAVASRSQPSRPLHEEIRDSFRSGSVTPASTVTFAPAAAVVPKHNPDFPNPNLYDATLLLYSEPGLEAWWSNVVHLMRDAYKAERVSLAVPADSTDLENVPWGQKATFYPVGGFSQSDAASLQRGSSSNTDNEADPDQTIHAAAAAEAIRGGSDDDTPIPAVSLTDFSKRVPLALDPPSVSRFDSSNTVTDSRPEDFNAASEATQFPDIADYFSRNTSGKVFDRLQPLQDDPDALLDNTGVLRVLERGKTVVISREYLRAPQPPTSDPSDSRPLKNEPKIDLSATPRTVSTKPRDKKTTPWPPKDLLGSHSRVPGNFHYEDFEQPISSPWTQSPAPSPAIRPDPNENPFFVNASVQEDSFNPLSSSLYYSTNEPVAAIGVERTMTIVHIPLVRPLAPSLVLSEARLKSETTPNGRSDEASGMFDLRRPSVPNKQGKPPIAILSFLTPVVPYPSNLVHSLSYLTPHMASSFSTARQFTQLESDALARARQSRNSLGERVASESISAETFDELSSLDRLRQAMMYDENQPLGPGSASVTSPSDYSAFSRSSPSGSRVGTPAWDPGFVGLANSSSNTPAHHPHGEVDGYFAAKRIPLNRAHTSAAITNTKSSSSSSSRPRTVSSQIQLSPKGSHGSDPSDSASPNRSSSNSKILDTKDFEASPEIEVQRRRESQEFDSPEHHPSLSESDRSSKRNSRLRAHTSSKPHTLLHSYGADFSATFQSMQPTTSLPRVPQHKMVARPTTSSSPFEMPPPSDRLLRTIVDSIPVQVFTAAPQTGDITWTNSRSLMYRNQTVSEFLRDPWGSIHPDDREHFLAMWGQALKQGDQFSHQVRIRRFDGVYRWFFVRAAPLRDARGVAVHWFGTNMDIHEQHIAEVNAARQEETAASEAKYRALANSSPQIVFACTEKEGMIFANTQWMRYSGQTLSESLGIGFADCVHPDDLEKCRLPAEEDVTRLPATPAGPSRNPSETSVMTSDSNEQTPQSEQTVLPDTGSNVTPGSAGGDLKQLAKSCFGKLSRDAEGRVSYSTEVRLKNKAGEYRWHLVRVLSVDAINFGNGEGSWFGTCTDINDHKLLEQRLKETMDSKTRFLSNMSHEIRTPLIGISGMVNFLLDTPLTGEQLDYCSTISSSAEGLLQVINDILDLSKAEAGMMRLARDWFHIRSLIEDTNELLSAMAIQKRLELNYIVETDVPLLVNGDRVRMRQVLLNIIGNAIKFTKEGEVFSRCSVVKDASVGADEIMIRFEVDDTGPGFTKADAELMFKPFSQIDGSSTRQHGGSGLGLVISRQLAELHGGKMNGNSIPGQGSTFVFTAKFGIPSEKSPAPPVRKSTKMVPVPAGNAVTAAGFSGSATRRAMDPAIPLLAKVLSQSPLPSGEQSPVLTSSGSSDPSLKSYKSLPSPRSSMSSYAATALPITPMDASSMKLSLPEEARIKVGSPTDSEENLRTSSIDLRPVSPEYHRKSSNSSAASSDSTPRGRASSTSSSAQFRPPMYSIMVLCPQKYSREAITSHIRATLPGKIPHQLTSVDSVEECQNLVGGERPVAFTHLVISIIDSDKIIGLIDQILNLSNPTSIIILSDPLQRTEIIQGAPQWDYDLLAQQKRLWFIYKPVKPSKFLSIFDPEKDAALELKTKSAAEHAAQTQRDAFMDMEKDVGNKGHRVLLVEDNPLNRKVMLKFLDKIGLVVETALDGVECTSKVFSQPPGYYSVVLCDLHMPRKDGYHTCSDIRRWERDNSYPRIPLIALSANVMDDAIEKALKAGFDKFFSKPVNFVQLSQAMTELLGASVTTEAATMTTTI